MEKDVLITPVTIIGADMIKRDRSLNNTFTAAYDFKIITDLGHYTMLKNAYIDAVKNGYSEPFEIWLEKLKDVDNIAFMDIMTGYLATNISEIMYSTLMSYSVGIGEAVHAPVQNKDINGFINENLYSKILSIAINVITGYNLSFTVVHENNYVMLNTMMDAILAHMMTEVVEVFINNFVNKLFATGLITNVYHNLYLASYNEAPEKEVSPDKTYVFVSGCLREVFNNYLPNLRVSLSHVATTAAQMVLNRLYYTDCVVDKSMNMNKLIETSDYAKEITDVINQQLLNTKNKGE